MQNRCAVLTCPSGKTDFQPMFRFPHDQERSRRWVEKCQGENLIGKSPEQLYRYYRICKRHFETSAFDCDADGAVLKKDAVPTIFDASVPPQSSQLKHSKDVISMVIGPKIMKWRKWGRKRSKRCMQRQVWKTSRWIWKKMQLKHISSICLKLFPFLDSRAFRQQPLL
ncbi:52 kDa repressor of the inhibitor of the protein kinase, partial [Oryzias latipes]|uniref:52 kDa repressor of the inhibitor of the protein kinase n=1 Tax=Oryzias latipes TaxID=8090 RepID=UPI0009DA58EE